MKYVIQDTTLTAIGDAIREKGGTTDLIPVVDLADAITNLPSGGGGEPLEQKYQITEGAGTFKNSNMAWLLDDYFQDSVEINIKNKSCQEMFYGAKFTDEQLKNLERVKELAPYVASAMFQNSNVKKLPITGFLINNDYQPKANNMCNGASMLEEIDDEVGAIMAEGFKACSGATNTNIQNMFYECTKLKYISPLLLKSWTGLQFSRDYYTTFYACNSLRALEGLGVVTAPYFYEPFYNLRMISKLTFDVHEDGTPYVVTNSKWGGNSFNLRSYFGWWSYSSPDPIYNSVDNNYKLSALKATGTNSTLFNYDTTPDFVNGTTIFTLSEAEIFNSNGRYDDLLENWWYDDHRYSRYGARELAETLLSLPDTSAVGNVNTLQLKTGAASCVKVLKQKGNALSILNTIDDVATNYPDAVAAATAKGWTLSFS